MEKEKTLSHLIKNRNRIEITPCNYLGKFKLLIASIIGAVLMFDIYILLSFRITFTSLAIVGVVSLAAVLISYYLKVCAKTTTLKGDTIIFNSIDNKSSVTSIRSIRKIKSKSALGIQWTKLNYNIDGTSKSAIILNRMTQGTLNPELTIRKALEISKKKANHKPGPVTAS
jgi:hypothetical protein